MGKPSFIIIGAERCGTTSLYFNICKHSKIYPAYTKEIEYFNRYYDRGPEWYELQFDNKPGRITGEATPAYFWNPKAPERIRSYNPGIKLIFIYRDTVSAVKSRHAQQVFKGAENLSFRDAIAFESYRIEGDLERVANLPYTYYPALYAEYAYQDRYNYEKHLKNWHGFDMLKIKSEDFFSNMDKTMQRVFPFLGLKFERHEWEHLNKGVCAE